MKEKETPEINLEDEQTEEKPFKMSDLSKEELDEKALIEYKNINPNDDKIMFSCQCGGKAFALCKSLYKIHYKTKKHQKYINGI